MPPYVRKTCTKEEWGAGNIDNYARTCPNLNVESLSERASSSAPSGKGHISKDLIDQVKDLETTYRNLRLFDPKELPSIDTLFAKNGEGGKHVRPIPRRGHNTSGKEVELIMNAYKISKFPTTPVHQYQVTMYMNGKVLDDKPRMVRRAWAAWTAEQNILRDIIFDGSHTAWSMFERRTCTGLVKLEVGYTEPSDLVDVTVEIIHRRKIFLAPVNEWLTQQRAVDERVIEALIFLDHLVRAWPSATFTPYKHAYYFHDKYLARDAGRDPMWHKIGKGASVYRGIFQMIRPSMCGLVLNVDAAHAVFWSRDRLIETARQLLACRTVEQAFKLLLPSKNGPSREFHALNKHIKGVRVFPIYKNCPFVKQKNFNIKELSVYFADTHIIEVVDKATGKAELMTVEKYFKKKYDVTLVYPKTPLVLMTRGEKIFYPMELVTHTDLGRYNHKLDDVQLGEMIKFTAKRPALRYDHILKYKKLLCHDTDPNLESYGLQVDPNMLKVKARLLPNPEIQFAGNAKINPGVKGRWDLRGKKFLRPNKVPLKHWAIGHFSGHRNSLNKEQIDYFVTMFTQIYKGHGGTIQDRPLIMELKDDVGAAVRILHDSLGKANKADPQLMIFIVPTKDMFVYHRIKKNCDCRFGVPSQVLQSTNVIQNNPIFISNFLMKVNAKLGGITNRVLPTRTGTGLRPFSLIIGADVTHAAVGVWTPSLAAMCVSADQHGISYMGGAECNGEHQETIYIANVRCILFPLVREWIKTVGKGNKPKFVYYLRDGVSESEYSNILNKEVPDIRKVIGEACGGDGWKGKLTVITANKRHHIRAFPNPKDKRAADNNGNPLPGTLIDRDIVSPHGWDFLLYSHTAIQGTARPVHYKVLLDEMVHKPDDLVNMIYEHSYQYVRSTTSVSIHPAIYYAHLISVRARQHEDVKSIHGPQHGKRVENRDPATKPGYTDPMFPADLLLDMKVNSNRLDKSMWWI
ncbi:hypothetical protein N7495_007981 [Penicillium taxi]|uniref:uncharacterized protein n=1 Tax=Penicillium taxi TaxID=168475 RepID=UPI0025457750|nr:uncharacterized protein N7495_007981 [Penicillium taxi]KAJ5887940.1 hypothetical protein N7495_007981 [Penicillium taxi]